MDDFRRFPPPPPSAGLRLFPSLRSTSAYPSDHLPCLASIGEASALSHDAVAEAERVGPSILRRQRSRDRGLQAIMPRDPAVRLSRKDFPLQSTKEPQKTSRMSFLSSFLSSLAQHLLEDPLSSAEDIPLPWFSLSFPPPFPPVDGDDEEGVPLGWERGTSEERERDSEPLTTSSCARDDALAMHQDRTREKRARREQGSRCAEGAERFQRLAGSRTLGFLYTSYRQWKYGTETSPEEEGVEIEERRSEGGSVAVSKGADDSSLVPSRHIKTNRDPSEKSSASVGEIISRASLGGCAAVWIGVLRVARHPPIRAAAILALFVVWMCWASPPPASKHHAPRQADSEASSSKTTTGEEATELHTEENDVEYQV